MIPTSCKRPVFANIGAFSLSPGRSTLTLARFIHHGSAGIRTNQRSAPSSNEVMDAVQGAFRSRRTISRILHQQMAAIKVWIPLQYKPMDRNHGYTRSAHPIQNIKHQDSLCKWHFHMNFSDAVSSLRKFHCRGWDVAALESPSEQRAALHPFAVETNVHNSNIHIKSFPAGCRPADRHVWHRTWRQRLYSSYRADNQAGTAAPFHLA